MTSSFSELGLSADLLAVLEKNNFTTPTPVQQQAIPPMLLGSDVIAQAQTGTGKTAAFALPLLERLDKALMQPQVLVLAPTRELAIQVAESFEQLAAHKLQVACLVGGSGYREQLTALKATAKRGPQIVIGTPGRVMDHMRRGSLKLQALNAFVLDEADEMLRMGFIEDVEWILEHLPSERQMALFSATMPDRVRQIAKRYLNEPQHITIKAKTQTVETVEQSFLFASFQQKEEALLRLLETQNYDGVIIFARTKSLTEELAQSLQQSGYSAKAINGDIPQAKRIQSVDELKSGKINILVATDVAARGLDIERISLVINYDIPFDAETYVHRIGRTGRAGRTGQAILFVTPKEARMLNLLERKTKQKITKIQLPTDAEIQEIRNQRFMQRIAKVMARGHLDSYKQVISDYQKEHDVDVLDIAAALVKMNQKPLRKLTQPKKSTDNKESRPRKEKRAKQSNLKGMPQEVYRLEVGKSHGAKARNIVGAIANEAGIESRYIDDLTIHDDYSTVRLPQGMPKKVFSDLKKAWVCGQQLQVSRVD